MNRRAVLLGSIPVLLVAGFAGRSLFRPRTDLELFADADLQIFPSDPLQRSEAAAFFTRRGAVVMPFARFSVSAVVLSARTYSPGDDLLGDAIPVDLALGWGAMSSPFVIRHVEIWQRGGFYFWKVPGGAPIAPSEVAASSSNMHIFPSGEDVEKKAVGLRRGDLVRIEGWLADLRIDGEIVRSSRTRTDTWGGACEIVYVESILVGA